MIVSDQLLMAYVDGELSPDAAAFVLSKVADDPALFQRLEQHRRLRIRLATTNGSVASEPAPSRLAALLSGGDPAARVRRQRESGRKTTKLVWAVAAATLVGVGMAEAGHLLFDPFRQSSAGAVAAAGPLAGALDNQLSGSPSADPSVAKVMASFMDGGGRYCRLFRSARTEGSVGVACKNHDHWTIESLTSVTGAAPDALAYRQAGSSLPQATVTALETLGGSAPLSDAQERQARDRAWVGREAASSAKRPGI